MRSSAAVLVIAACNPVAARRHHDQPQEDATAVPRRRADCTAAQGTQTRSWQPAPVPVAALPNQRWSLGFVHGQLASGRRFRVLNVVDDVTRECLAAVPDTAICGKRVVCELNYLIAVRSKPGMIVSDNGTERNSNAVLEWCGAAKIDWNYTPRESQPRTRSFRVVTGGCAMNCLMRHCSPASIMPAGRSLHGIGIITQGGLTPRSDTPPQRSLRPN